MSEIKTVEIWVAVDSDGDIGVDTDNAEDAASGLAEIRRVIKLTVQVPIPTIPEAVVTIPEESGEVIVTTV